MVSEISLAYPLPAKARKINTETISFNHNLPKRFLTERKKILSNSETVVRGKPPVNYSYVKTTTHARDIYKAYEQAEDSLDFLRGIWNYILSPSTSFRLSFNKRDPVNKIILGPLRTLHEPSGKAATTIYYYQDSYFAPIEKLSLKDDVINQFILAEKDIRQALAKCTYASLIRKAIIRYVRALDDTNWHSAFLNLWGVLEQLTGSGFDSYKVTIRRAAFLYNDIDYHTQVLLHLKEFRNSNVHAGETTGNIEKYMYQLKSYVELLIKYHLFHTKKLNDFDSAIAVLDLPPKKQSLSKRALILQTGVKFKSSITRQK